LTQVQNLDWESMQAEQKVNVSFETLCEAVLSIGGNVWKEAVNNAFRVNIKEYPL
jgi:hypothetical protein